jgi:ribosomal protein S27AE
MSFSEEPWKNANTKCPICGNVGAVVRDSELRYACGLCGAPRIPGVESPGREAPLLVRANDARVARAKARFLAGFAGAGVGLSFAFFGLLLLLFGLKLSLLAVATLVTAPFALLLTFALRRAAASGRDIRPQIDAAYVAAAGELAARNEGNVTAAQLEKTLGVDAAHAEELVNVVQLDASIGAGPLRIATPRAAAGGGAAGGAKTLEQELAEMEAQAELEASATVGQARLDERKPR